MVLVYLLLFEWIILEQLIGKCVHVCTITIPLDELE